MTNSASAALYSLIETAKAIGVEPYAYRRILFANLPLATYKKEITALLSQNFEKARLVIS